MCAFLQAPEGFNRETLQLLDRAFLAIWCELQARKSSPPCEENDQTTQTAMAKSIVNLAASGIREPGRLERHAHHAAEQARPRAKTIVHLSD